LFTIEKAQGTLNSATCLEHPVPNTGTFAVRESYKVLFKRLHKIAVLSFDCLNSLIMMAPKVRQIIVLLNGRK